MMYWMKGLTLFCILQLSLIASAQEQISNEINSVNEHKVTAEATFQATDDADYRLGYLTYLGKINLMKQALQKEGLNSEAIFKEYNLSSKYYLEPLLQVFKEERLIASKEIQGEINRRRLLLLNHFFNLDSLLTNLKIGEMTALPARPERESLELRGEVNKMALLPMLKNYLPSELKKNSNEALYVVIDIDLMNFEYDKFFLNSKTDILEPLGLQVENWLRGEYSTLFKYIKVLPASMRGDILKTVKKRIAPKDEFLLMINVKLQNFYSLPLIDRDEVEMNLDYALFLLSGGDLKSSGSLYSDFLKYEGPKNEWGSFLATEMYRIIKGAPLWHKRTFSKGESAKKRYFKFRDSNIILVNQTVASLNRMGHFAFVTNISKEEVAITVVSNEDNANLVTIIKNAEVKLGDLLYNTFCLSENSVYLCSYELKE